MRRALYALLVLSLLAATAHGQARTAERIVTTTFSQLNSGNPGPGSVRVVINGTEGSSPCTVGPSQVFAIKLDGVWHCPFRAGGSGGGGSGNVTGPSASGDGELPLFSGTTGKVIKRSNSLTGYVKVASGFTSASPIAEADLPSFINATKIADGSVSDAEFQFLNGVTSAIQTQLAGKLGGPLTGDVTTVGTTATIADNSVTGAKIALGLDTRGDIMFYNGADWERLPPGTTGRFLRTGGADADPSWEPVPGGGDALTANPLSQFAATTSAQLAGVLNDETGSSGGFVRAVSASLVSPNITTPTGIVKGDVGLGNVDNTSDANKPVSTAQQTALNAKQPLDTDLTAIAGLADPNADRILFWDDSVGAYAHLTVGSGLNITGTTITATGVGTGDVVGPSSSTDNTVPRFDGTTGKIIEGSSVSINDSNNLSTPGSVSAAFLASGAADPADSGAVRLGNNEAIAWENATPGTDLTLKVNTSNELESSASLRISETGAGTIGLGSGGTIDAGLVRSAAAKVKVTDGSSGYGDLDARQYYADATITAAGTTGNQTINKSAGTVNVAASGTAITVTNSLVSTSSLVFAFARTNDSTCAVKNAVPGAGTVTINMTAACTAETSIAFWVLNK